MDNQQRRQRPQIQFLALPTELFALPAVHAVLGSAALSIEGEAVSLTSKSTSSHLRAEQISFSDGWCSPWHCFGKNLSLRPLLQTGDERGASSSFGAFAVQWWLWQGLLQHVSLLPAQHGANMQITDLACPSIRFCSLLRVFVEALSQGSLARSQFPRFAAVVAQTGRAYLYWAAALLRTRKWQQLREACR